MPPTDPLVGSAPPPPATTTTVAPPPPPKEEAHPMPGEPPLAPTPGPVQTYQVRTPETLRDLARHTMGNSDRWADIYKLNPNLKPEATLAAGTLVRLPGDACVQPDDVEPVKPLPALRPKAPAKAKVVLPLTGTFPCNLDDKKAMTLPKAIRDQLGGSDTVLISPGPDRCLWLTNQAHLERLAQRLEQSPAREADVRIFKRLYFAQTEKTALTADGRVAVSERLAQFAGLHQEVVLIGIDDHFELWDAGRWRQYTQQKSAACGKRTLSRKRRRRGKVGLFCGPRGPGGITPPGRLPFGPFAGRRPSAGGFVVNNSEAGCMPAWAGRAPNRHGPQPNGWRGALDDAREQGGHSGLVLLPGPGRRRARDQTARAARGRSGEGAYATRRG
jgi:MraZ protein